MKTDFNPEKLLKDYEEGILKRDSLIDILISGVNLKIDPYTAEKSIRILGDLGKIDKVFKFLENCVNNDIYPSIRARAIEVIFQNYLSKGRELIKWVIQNDTSDSVIRTIIEMIKKHQNEEINDLNKSMLERFSEVFKVNFEEAEFFRDSYQLIASDKISINGSYTYEFHNFYHSPRYRSHFIGTEDNQAVFLNLSGKLNQIPESICHLRSLKYLIMKHSNLQSLPENIGYLKKLKVLDLKENSLYSLPKGIGQFRNLKYINLLYNHIKDLPDSLYELVEGNRSKRYIRFGVIPEEACVLGLFEILTGWKLVKVSEELLRFMEGKQMLLHEANYYVLDENGHIIKIFLYSRFPILSLIPKNIRNLQFLEELHLYHNDIKALPSTLLDLHNLKELHLSESKIQEIPDDLKKFVNSLEKFSY